MKNIFLLSALILSVSCDPQDPKSEVNEMISSNSMAISPAESKHDSVSLTQTIQNLKEYSTAYYSYPIKFPDDYTREDYIANKDGFLAFQDLNKLLKAYLNKNDNSNEEKIKDFLSKNKMEKYYFQLAQWSALTILDQKLLKEEMSALNKERIAYYTNILLEQEYNHSEVIARSLSALKGYWEDDQIGAISEICLQRTLKFNSINESSLDSNIIKSDQIGNEILRNL